MNPTTDISTFRIKQYACVKVIVMFWICLYFNLNRDKENYYRTWLTDSLCFISSVHTLRPSDIQVAVAIGSLRNVSIAVNFLEKGLCRSTVVFNQIENLLINWIKAKLPTYELAPAAMLLPTTWSATFLTFLYLSIWYFFFSELLTSQAP